MIRAILTVEFSDIWGADEFWADGGEKAIKEMVMEDLGAFIEEAKWVIDASNYEPKETGDAWTGGFAENH